MIAISVFAFVLICSAAPVIPLLMAGTYLNMGP
jgi:hypothetical protein